MQTIPGKKQILRDPIKALATRDVSETQQQAVHRLWQQLQPLREDIHRQQDDSRRLSRLIGAAKKAGDQDRLASLLAQMRAHSTRLKPLQQQAGELEQQLLAMFTSHPDDTEAATGSDDDSPGQSPQRRYPRQMAPQAPQVYISELDTEGDAWNAYAASHPHGCFHHRWEWRRVITDTYGHRCYYLLARYGDGRLAGLLPLVYLHSRLFGRQLVSMPWFARAGVIADSAAIEQDLLQHAAKLADSLACERIEYRDDTPRAAMPVLDHKVNMVLSLPHSSEALWQRFDAKLRAQIRRSRREPVQIRFGGEALLADFYQVYSRNMRDLGSPVHSAALIANSLRQFPGHSHLAVVYLGKRPVAGGFLLQQDQYMEIPLASTIRPVRHLSINMFLYWEILQFAIRQGCRQFDFGRSSRDAGTYRFKKQWGAQPKNLYWHYHLAAGSELPALKPDSTKFKLLIAAWQKLPLPLSRLLGPRLVKNIP